MRIGDVASTINESPPAAVERPRHAHMKGAQGAAAAQQQPGV